MSRVGYKTVMFLLCSISAFSPSKTFGQGALPDALRLDLKRLEETWRVLDKFAGKAWPGWKGYTEIPLRFDYPNGLSLHIGDPPRPEKFKVVEGVMLRDRKVYLDESRLNSTLITPRLEFAGGGAGLGTGHPTIRVHRSLITKERERLADSLVRSYGNSTWPSEVAYSTDMTILGFVHELFHCFTDFGPMYYSGDKLFDPDLNYAIFSEIESDLLEKAAFQSDTGMVNTYLTQALVAREKKKQSMTDGQIVFECDREKAEGTAEYVSHRIAQLLKSGYEPGLTQREDPLYFAFRYSDYFPAMRLKDFRDSRKNTLDAIAKNYANGFFFCLILDKLRPNWKDGFFANKKTFDGLVSQLVDLKKEEKSGILEQVMKDYQYEKLFQYHAPILAECDSVVNYFKDPAKRLFVISHNEMGVSPKFTTNGKTYRRDMQYYYARGYVTVQIGDMTLEVQGAPLYRDIRTTSIKLRGGDTSSTAGGYDLKFGRQDADGSYYDVDISWANVKMHATKLKISQTPRQVEFKILPATR